MASNDELIEEFASGMPSNTGGISTLTLRNLIIKLQQLRS